MNNQTTTKKSKSEEKERPLNRKQRESDQPVNPVLRFTPYAWAKFQWFCHYGETEIGGFGVTPSDDPLLIIDFVTVKQSVTSISVSFDDEAVADFFEQQVDAGRRPEQFARQWLHTHPGDCPHPSSTDEQTFTRVFGPCEWAVMFILAHSGTTYARLRFNVGPKGQAEIPMEVDFTQPFAGSNHQAWRQEYQANIQVETLDLAPIPESPFGQLKWDLLPKEEDPTVEQEELELLARTQDMSPDELEDFFNESEVWL